MILAAFLRAAAVSVLRDRQTLPLPRYFRSLGTTFRQACPGVPGERAAALVGSRLLWPSRPPFGGLQRPALRWVPIIVYHGGEIERATFLLRRPLWAGNNAPTTLPSQAAALGRVATSTVIRRRSPSG